jgi:CheY-like chemotaxis protein
MQQFNILFTDDEPICHDVIKLVLSKRSEYQIFSAYNGADTIKILQQDDQKIDLIFLDILLPDITGHEIYKIIKSNDNFINIPIIFQSGMNIETKEVQEILQEPNVSVIYKPYSNNILVNLIEEYHKKSLDI